MGPHLRLGGALTKGGSVLVLQGDLGVRQGRRAAFGGAAEVSPRVFATLLSVSNLLTFATS